MAVAVITGASRGLGRALAEGLIDTGWAVVLDARDAGELRQAADRLGHRPGVPAVVVARPGDVREAAHRAALLAAAIELGGVDLLVNNASRLGPSPQPSLARYPLDELRSVYEVNVMAPLALIQAALPLLRQAPAGRVVNVTSDAGLEAYPGWGGYGSSKAALDLLSGVLAGEEPTLRVWAVDPGDLRTRMHQEAFPGEDISDRPEPETVIPAFLHLLASDRPSGRVRLSDLEVRS